MMKTHFKDANKEYEGWITYSICGLFFSTLDFSAFVRCAENVTCGNCIRLLKKYGKLDTKVAAT
jgi:hypothetical protein